MHGLRRCSDARVNIAAMPLTTLATDAPLSRPPDNLPVTRTTAAQWLTVAALGLALVMAWDATALDLPLARLFGDASGFAHRNDWWLTQVLHDGARNASWALTAVLAVMVVWPRGVMRSLSRRERIGLLLGVVASVLTMSVMKYASTTSCPWDLQEFGGRAGYVSHWRWGVADGGGGHCFPAGHASAGFAYIGGWLWLRRAAPRAAMAWLVGALLLGLGLGAVQQVRGAHYTSHTLWTAWLCWTVSGAVWWALQRWAARGRPAQ